MSYKPWTMVRITLSLAVIFLATSCAPTKIIKPLDEGQWQIGGTVGRPQINDGSLPILGAYAAKGVSADRTIYGGVQLSSALLGAAHIEGGQVQHLRQQNGLQPAISWSAGAQALMSTRDYAFRLYPETGINAYWHRGPHILNASANTWVDPTWFLTEYGRGQILAPSFSAGYRFRYGFIEAQVEYKILNPTREILVPQADVPNTFGLGAKGIYWGVALNF
jgi:hypothetical protein